MVRTKQQKADYDRKRKKEQIRERRFTKPLKLFFQRKYSDSYKEYLNFFNEMDNKYPGKKDLTKSEMFRKFLSLYPAENETITPSSPSETTIKETTTPSSPSETTIKETTSSPSSAETTIKETTIPPSPSETTIKETTTPSSPSETTIKETTSSPSSAETTIKETTIPPSPSETTIKETTIPPSPSETTIKETTTTPTSPSETTTTPPSPSETTIAPVQTALSVISSIADDLFGPGGLDQYVEHMENLDEGIDVNILDELRLDFTPFDFELETEDF